MDMLVSRSQYNEPFWVFCMKDLNYVINVMESWMILDELEGTKIRREFTDRSGANKKLFT